MNGINNDVSDHESLELIINEFIRGGVASVEQSIAAQTCVTSRIVVHNLVLSCL